MTSLDHFTRAAMSSRRATLLLLASAGLVACGTTEADGPLSPSGAQGRVRFVNVINDTTRGRVNAILEGVPFGVNLTYTQATPASLAAPNTAPYAAVLTGGRTIVLKRTADTTTTVASLGVTVDANVDKSVYAIGGSGGSPITAFVTTDTNSTPTLTQARVRFVHLAPSAPPVDVFFTAAGADLALATPTFANVSYRGLGGYVALAAGTYQVRAVPVGTSPANRAASVAINVTGQALAGGAARTFVAADNTTGGAPLRAFALTDR